MTVKNIFITVANLDSELEVGKELTYAQLKGIDQKYGEEAVGEFIAEKGLVFKALDIQEIHLHDFDLHGSVEDNCDGYPVLLLDHATQSIVLESSFGSGPENKIVCKKVQVRVP